MTFFSANYSSLNEDTELERTAARPTKAEWKPRRPRRPRRTGRLSGSRMLPPLLAVTDAVAAIIATSIVSFVYEQQAFAINNMVFGLLLASVFGLATLTRHGYSVAAYLKPKGQMRHVLNAWALAFVAVLSVGFFTKSGDYFSRGFAGLVLVAGLVTLMLVRALLSRLLIARARTGRVAARSIFVVGDEDAVRAFSTSFDFASLGLRLLGAGVVRPEAEHLIDDLSLTSACARMLRPDDIFILAPWSDRALISQCVETFMRLPASIHIGPDALFQQFSDMHIVRNGPLTSVHLLRSPLSPFERAVKRSFDLIVATVAVLLLLPILAAVAILIKLDSPGPVLFRQTRYGFNQEPFRIFKFRSMTVAENGAVIRQATLGDRRITRIGALLRRSNLDELPQLFNVILGDMSLVGPRPHALAHDQAFGRSVSLYARRHNVRPGITGWAQVHGWRGETDTADKIQGRIACDLHYIDNWSLWLDVVVLARTVLSRNAYMNAR